MTSTRRRKRPAVDFDAVLEYVFAQSECRIFESHSAFDPELIEFSSADMLKEKVRIGQCTSGTPSTLLHLVVPGASKFYHIRKTDLSLEKCGGNTFQYTIEGGVLFNFLLTALPHVALSPHIQITVLKREHAPGRQHAQ